jgi:uncharacterized repeat protein (TIGR03803 family)
MPSSSLSPRRFALPLVVAGLFLGAMSHGTAAPSVAGFQTLHTFAARPFNPRGSLAQGLDGDTYGTTQNGGRDGIGTVFKIAAGKMVTLYSFALTNGGIDGGQPETGLTLGADGNFYGTTAVGGVNGNGTIFRITPQGQLTTLHHFSAGNEESNPTRLVQGSDGNLYGTTTSSYSDSPGTAFRISPTGIFTRLHHFSVGVFGGNGPDGGFPGPLMQAKDGNFYGIATSGGAHGAGTFFRLTPNGDLTVIYDFASGQNLGARSGLVEVAPGEFYGSSAGWGGIGKIFRVTAAGVYTTLHSFTGGSSDVLESESLILGDDGNLYGACPTGGSSSPPAYNAGIVFRITPAGVFSVIHEFTGSLDGKRPRCALIRTASQTFRGITTEAGPYGKGTVFEIAGDGTSTTIAGFSSGSDGATPIGAMVEAENGDLYGSTGNGGLFGSGTIFRISTNGELTPLYNFQGKEDGSFPGGVAFGPDGSLYGISYYGVSGYQPAIFKVSRSGDFTSIRSYISEQEKISGGLVLGSDGNFYATQPSGGVNGTGAIVRMTPSGAVTVIHSFTRSTDGSAPECRLAMDSNGFVYGATSFGGANGKGTIYKCSPAGDFTVLHNFATGEGQDAENDVVLRSDGSLYGATREGGANGYGIVYRLAANGAFNVLYDFGPRDGFAGTSLIVASDDNIYGTSSDGGDFGHGMLFEIARDGSVATLHSFSGGADGDGPGTLTEASSGRLYGNTGGGGGADKLGTLYSVPLTKPGRLANIATRMRVSTGDNVLIAGFVVTGFEPKKVIIRGIGPSLEAFGVQGALSNPTLELHLRDTTLSNDDWKEHQAEVEATTIPPRNDLESAIVTTLDPGAYTVILAGKNQTSGIGLIEVYDLAPAASSKLANISSRGFIDTGDDAMFGGFIAGPADGAMTKVLIRGIGPSLAQLGVPNALSDPILELHNGDGTLITTNDDWKISDSGASQQAEIEATTIPPHDDHESAILQTLAPVVTQRLSGARTTLAV